MKLLVISDPKHNKEEKQIVLELFENGLSYFHLRKKKWSSKNIQKFLDYFPQKYQKKIIIHSNHDLIGKVTLGGIHFNREQKKNELIWLKHGYYKLTKPKLIYSTSISHLDSIKNIPKSISYVLLNNVFDGITRNSSPAAYSQEAIREFLSSTNRRIVALGGVSLDTIETAIDLGFYGAALVGAVWQSDDPVDAFINIRDKCEGQG